MTSPAKSPPLVGAAARVSLHDWIRALRPAQWIKNSFVMTPLLFSGQVGDPGPTLAAVAAFGLFCAVASGVYLGNDVADRAADRVHPAKRTRPIAAGRISAGHALGAAGALVALGTVGGWLLAPAFGLLLLLYALLNVLYSAGLKAVVILDVFLVASGFVLRLIAGSVVVRVEPSIWLLLCGGLLALYLGFAKRRHELTLLRDGSATHRTVLEHYSLPLLDQLASVLLSVTVVAYIMYTLTSETAALVGSDALAYSTLFVLYGVFRYLYLVHQQNRGSPTETLLTDPALLVDVALWLLYCGWVIYRPF